MLGVPVGMETNITGLSWDGQQNCVAFKLECSSVWLLWCTCSNNNCFQTVEGCSLWFYWHQLTVNVSKLIIHSSLQLKPHSVSCCTSGEGMGMEKNICRNWWGWNESSAGMGGDESTTGHRQVGTDITSVGMAEMGVIFVPMQACTGHTVR